MNLPSLYRLQCVHVLYQLGTYVLVGLVALCWWPNLTSIVSHYSVDIRWSILAVLLSAGLISVFVFADPHFFNWLLPQLERRVQLDNVRTKSAGQYQRIQDGVMSFGFEHMDDGTVRVNVVFDSQRNVLLIVIDDEGFRAWERNTYGISWFPPDEKILSLQEAVAKDKERNTLATLNMLTHALSLQPQPSYK